MKQSWLQNSSRYLASEDTIKQLINFNCQLASLIRSNRYSDSLQLFRKLHSSQSHLKPDQYSLSTILTACPKISDVFFGNQIHACAISSGLKSYPHVTNTLLSFYAKSSDLISVKKVFDDISNPDVYSWTGLLSACSKLGEVSYACQLIDEMPRENVALWNAIITGCSENGQVEVSFDLFNRMHMLGVRHDKFTFACILSLCSSRERYLLDFGRSAHSLVVKTGTLGATSVVNALVSMYFGHGDIVDGYRVFEEAHKEFLDEVTYNAMINGLASLGRDDESLMMFKEMKLACHKPSELTFVRIMSSCLDTRICYQMHAEVVKAGYEPSTTVSNAAMGMYANHRDIDSVCNIFEALNEKDVVSWNTMIAAYAQNSMHELAISTYVQMRRDRFMPDEYTVGSVLASSGCLEFVEMFHALVLKIGLSLVSEALNAVFSALCKHGDVEQAYRIFHDMHSKSLISWNAMISGFSLNDSPVEGLKLFSELLKSTITPDLYTLTIVLSICASISALEHGKQIHSYILRYGYSENSCLGNALITMYAKCGALYLSRRVFDAMSRRDVVSWNALISAFGQCGEGKTAVQWFSVMLDDASVRPDHTTFTTVLSACSHAGLVDDGIRIFNSMIGDHGLEPQVDHFSCLIDLLGRAGYLDETEELIQGSKHMTIDASVWWTLFSACTAYGNVRLGRIVARLLRKTEQDNPSVYVLLSNIQAAVGQWEESANVRELMKQVGVLKHAGCSWIRQ